MRHGKTRHKRRGRLALAVDQVAVQFGHIHDRPALIEQLREAPQDILLIPRQTLGDHALGLDLGRLPRGEREIEIHAVRMQKPQRDHGGAG